LNEGKRWRKIKWLVGWYVEKMEKMKNVDVVKDGS